MATTKLLLLALLFGLVLGQGDVLLEVSFDLASEEKTEDGYTAADSVNAYLNSTHLMWLRYFHVLVSDQQVDVPMRVAQLMFKDTANWAAFEDETIARTHVLHDHFWVNSRRVVWLTSPSKQAFPSNGDRRSSDKPGGFMWQFKFSILPNKEAEWNNYWNAQASKLIGELENNNGFVEAQTYSANIFRRSLNHMFEWEFLTMEALSKSVFESTAVADLLDNAPKYLAEWSTVILAPPAEGQTGLFWQASGAQQAPDADTQEQDEAKE